MGLGGCYAILKYLVFIVNLIFWISGLAIIVLSLWMLTDPTFYVSMAQDESSYYCGIYMLLIIGILLFIVGFLGCCGTIRESQCMLVLFFCFLIIILVGEISAAAWAYSNRHDLEKLIRENVEVTVRQEYGVVDSRTTTFDAIQQGLECCGAKGPTDWLSSKFNNAEKQRVELTISSVPKSYNIPSSCCRDDPQSVACLNAKTSGITGGIPNSIYSEGCSDKLVYALSEYANTFIGVGIAIASCQLLGLIFSLILCCGIQQRDRYKA